MSILGLISQGRMPKGGGGGDYAKRKVPHTVGVQGLLKGPGSSMVLQMPNHAI